MAIDETSGSLCTSYGCTSYGLQLDHLDAKDGEIEVGYQFTRGESTDALNQNWDLRVLKDDREVHSESGLAPDRERSPSTHTVNISGGHGDSVTVEVSEDIHGPETLSVSGTAAASISDGDISVSCSTPDEVNVDESFDIEIEFGNSSDATGVVSYTLNVVDETLEEDVTVPGTGTESVTHTVSIDTSGEYTPSVEVTGVEAE